MIRDYHYVRQQSWFRSLLLLQLLTASSCAAANSFTSTPVSDALTYSSVRITWTTSENSTTVIRWGPNGPPYANRTTAYAQASDTRAHGWFLSGLKPVTSYHFTVCSTNAGSPEICSEDQTFTTTERGDTRPVAPMEVDLTMPPGGNELFVGANCQDPSSGLMARWNEANWGDTVVIPVTTRCTGTYVFPVKAADTASPHRWIITRTSAVEQLPPPGSRIDPIADAGKFALVQTNRPTLLLTSSGNLPGGCEAGGYAWVFDNARAFKLQQCRPEVSQPITGGTGEGVPIVITVPNHGFTGNPYVRVQGVTGNTKANGTFQAVVTGPSTMQLNYLGFQAWRGNGVFTGGTVAKNSWQPVAFSTGTSLPETCLIGAWHLLVANGIDPQDSTYRCLETNNWTLFSLRGSSDTRDSAAINLSDNAAHHLRFIGLEVTSVRLPLEPLWQQLSVDPLRRQPGSVFFSLVSQGVKNNHIIWDRCWVHGQSDRSRQWIGFTLDGSDVAVVDSFVSDMFVWSGIEPASGVNEAGSTAFYIPVGPGPIRIENNYVEAGGISLYVPSDWCCGLATEPSDGVVRRNTFHVGDEWRFGSASFAGRKIVVRHLLELKQGRRWLIEGNTFDGTFTTVNQAAAIALTPRADAGFFVINGITDGVATMNPLFGHCPEDVRAGDWVVVSQTSNNAHHTGWQVTAVADGGCTVTLADITESSTGGKLQIMTNRRALTDIDVRSNTFKNVANGVFIIGHTDGANAPSLQLETTRRIRLHNNLFQSIDGSRSNQSDTSYYPAGLGGFSVYASLGMEDLHFTHNTIVQSTPGPGFAIEVENACIPTRNCNPHAGLVYENNIIHYGAGTGVGAINASGTLFGQAALDGLWRLGDDPGWSYRKNVIATRGPLPTLAPFGPYPPGNRTHDLNNGDLPFINPSAGNFRLRALYRVTDNCYGQRGDCTTTGQDVGVNFDQLSTAQGLTSQARLQRAGSRQLAIHASVYRAGYCAAEVSTNSFLTATPATTIFGEGRSRTFWFDNLNPSTLYQYRARCSNGSILTGQVPTRSVGVDRRFQLRFKPPLWMAGASAINAVIFTGTSATTLNTTTTLLCTTGCSFEIPAADGVLLYYRVEYRRPRDVTVASGPIRAWAP